MNILSLDCAGAGCGVCVWQDGRILSEKHEAMDRGQDRRLMPLIDEALSIARLSFDQIDRIVVTRGPGSFTGLRIGLAAARGIGLAAQKPVIGLDRFALFRRHFPQGEVLVVLQSRRDELYCRHFPADGSSQTATMMTREDIAAFAAAHANAALVGDVNDIPGLQTLTLPEHVWAAELSCDADPEIEQALPLYVRAPDVTAPKNSAETRRDGIHPVSIGHAAELARLHAESFGPHAWNQAQLRSSLALDTTKGWASYANGQMTGFVLCQIVPGQSEILTIAVAPAFRRHGSAIALMHMAETAALNSQSDLFLEVAADNLPAIGLYKKLGFHQSGRRPRYYNRPDTSIDALLLTKTLKTA